MKLNIKSLHEENKSLLVENEALYSMLCKRQ
jgi:regulator of replication initiation timing